MAAGTVVPRLPESTSVGCAPVSHLSSAVTRRLAITAVALAVLGSLFFLGLRFAVARLQKQIEGALGPRTSIGALAADWSGIELRELRVRAGSGWPAEDELRARRVRVEPELRSLFGGPWRIARIEVEGAYLSAMRTREGRLRLLPALLEERKPQEPADAAGAEPKPELKLEIAKVRLADATLAFFDASVVRRGAAPLPLRVEQLQAEAGSIALPTLDHAIALKLEGIFKGERQDGRLAIEGELTPATQDARLQARFSGVDLLTLQPYLLKAAETGVRRGTLDLVLQAQVRDKRLHAPGTLTLHHLELANEGGMLSTFAGVPRQAVLAALTRGDKLEVKFTLEGRLDDPAFSLNESLATKIASGLADGLGVSLSGVVKGLGGVVKGLLGR